MPSRLALAAVAAILAILLAACGGRAERTGRRWAVSRNRSPQARMRSTTSIDTSKVKKNLTVGVLNPHYIFHNDILVALEKGYFKEVGIDSVDIKVLDDPIPRADRRVSGLRELRHRQHHGRLQAERIRHPLPFSDVRR